MEEIVQQEEARKTDPQDLAAFIAEANEPPTRLQDWQIDLFSLPVCAVGERFVVEKTLDVFFRPAFLWFDHEQLEIERLIVGSRLIFDLMLPGNIGAWFPKVERSEGVTSKIILDHERIKVAKIGQVVSVTMKRVGPGTPVAQLWGTAAL